MASEKLISIGSINPLQAKFFRVNINIYLYLMSFLHIDMTQVIKDLHIPYSQYHGCWCLGDLRSQGISSYDIDLVKPRKLGPRTSRVNGMLPHGTQPFTQANVDLPARVCYQIHQRDILLKLLLIPIPKICLKITYLKLLSYLPGIYDLKKLSVIKFNNISWCG